MAGRPSGDGELSGAGSANARSGSSVSKNEPVDLTLELRQAAQLRGWAGRPGPSQAVITYSAHEHRTNTPGAKTVVEDGHGMAVER